MQKDARGRGSVVKYIRLPLSLASSIEDWRKNREERDGFDIGEPAAIRRLIEIGLAVGRRGVRT